MAAFFASGPQMPFVWAAGRLTAVGVDDDGVGGVDEVGDGGDDGSTGVCSILIFFSSPLVSGACDEGPLVVVVLLVVAVVLVLAAALAALAHAVEQ